jgi:quercetin dioxygenase-like cupin family protein
VKKTIISGIAALAILAPTDTAATKDAPNAPVQYFDKDTVSASFAKGGVLYHGDKLNVHTSRRDAPGQVEVHTKDTDTIYVVDGTATFVTGGTMVGGKQVAADEFRGSEITGGDVHKLAKGDVIIVPAGTPHWYKEVSGPFFYLTVKSR